MILHRPVVEVLGLVGEEHAEHLAEPTGLGQDGLGLRPRERGAEPNGERTELGVPA